MTLYTIALILVGLFVLATAIQFIQMNMNVHPSKRIVYQRIVDVNVPDSSKSIHTKANTQWKEMKGEVNRVHTSAVKPANRHTKVVHDLGVETPAD